MTDTKYQSRVGFLLPTKNYGEADSVTHEHTVALYTIGFDLQLAVQACQGHGDKGARQQLFVSDGNYIMTLAVLAGTG
jgi:hypothetical protein